MRYTDPSSDRSPFYFHWIRRRFGPEWKATSEIPFSLNVSTKVFVGKNIASRNDALSNLRTIVPGNSEKDDIEKSLENIVTRLNATYADKSSPGRNVALEWMSGNKPSVIGRKIARNYFATVHGAPLVSRGCGNFRPFPKHGIGAQTSSGWVNNCAVE